MRISGRDALATAIGALNIVADVALDERLDALRVTFPYNERTVLLDSELGENFAACFELLKRELGA